MLIYSFAYYLSPQVPEYKLHEERDFCLLLTTGSPPPEMVSDTLNKNLINAD